MPEKTSKSLPAVSSPVTGRVKSIQERGRIKNKLTLFPEHDLDEIDKLIGNGRGSTFVLKYLGLNYKGTLVLPGRSTIDAYMNIRRAQLEKMVDDALEAEYKIISLNPIPDLRSVDSRDKRALLDTILRKLGERVEIVEDVQKEQVDPRFEKLLIEALAEMRETIVEQVSMDTELGVERERLQAVMTVLLKHISGSVSQAYKDIHGEEKLESFVKSLEKRLDNLSFDVIEEEILAVVTEKPASVTVTVEEK